MMLVCLCRLIDSDDFKTDDALEARIMDADFQSGQCQLYYLMSHGSEPTASLPMIIDTQASIELRGELNRKWNPAFRCNTVS